MIKTIEKESDITESFSGKFSQYLSMFDLRLVNPEATYSSEFALGKDHLIETLTKERLEVSEKYEKDISSIEKQIKKFETMVEQRQ